MRARPHAWKCAELIGHVEHAETARLRPLYSPPLALAPPILGSKAELIRH